jgi:hypothetical protein
MEHTSGKTQPNSNSIDKCRYQGNENNKANKHDYNNGENKTEVQDKKSKDKRYLLTKAALNVISEDLIPKHKAANTTYWEASPSNHCTIECYSNTPEHRENLEIPTVSLLRKGQRSDEDTEVKNK